MSSGMAEELNGLCGCDLVIFGSHDSNYAKENRLKRRGDRRELLGEVPNGCTDLTPSRTVAHGLSSAPYE